MKISTISVACLALALAACKSETASSSAEWKAKIPATAPISGSLVVVGTLQPTSGAFPANDLYKYAFVMKYAIDSVVSGTFAGTEILVGQYDPRTPRATISDDQKGKVGGNVDGFHPGDRHYLVLSPMDSAWTGAVEDDNFQDKSPRWFAVWSDKI
ncbi:MAG: hypothetical protein AAB214_10280 [Fibrobacterota bacterium]